MYRLSSSGNHVGLVKVPVYLALMHSHVLNRKGESVTTSVTNLDIHDISRSARTFGVTQYFLVTPLEDQNGIVERILQYWRSEFAQVHHPDRVEAVSLVRRVSNFDEVKSAIREAHQKEPEVVLTDARPYSNSISYADYRQELESRGPDGRPVLLVFGTGWGIPESFHPAVDRILAPIYGPEGPESSEGYNHLSVRAAAAIILDRLFGH